MLGLAVPFAKSELRSVYYSFARFEDRKSDAKCRKLGGFEYLHYVCLTGLCPLTLLIRLKQDWVNSGTIKNNFRAQLQGPEVVANLSK